jgi:hypothetical protein
MKLLLTPFIFFLALLIISCTPPKPVIEPTTTNDYLSFIPVAPQVFPYYQKYDIRTNKWNKVDWPDCADSILNLLPQHTSNVQVFKIEGDGKISYLSAAVSAKVGYYKIIMDFAKFRDVPIYEGDAFIGTAKVGVTLRVQAKIVTSDEDINLGSLFAIGAGAEAKTLKGEISAEIIGIDGKDITNILPLTSKIDQTSIENILQALASIKTRIWEVKKITPHLIGISNGKGSIEQLIKKAVADTVSFGYSNTEVTLSGFLNLPECKDSLIMWIDSNAKDAKSDYFRFIHAPEFENLRGKALEYLKQKGECNAGK